MRSRTPGLPSGSPIVETTVEDGEPTGRVVVTAVAAVADDPVLDLPPLSETIDPDALDALFPDEAATGHVAFTYDGFLVAVTAAGAVQVYDGESA